MRSTPGSGEKVARFSITITLRSSFASHAAGSVLRTCRFEHRRHLIFGPIDPLARRADHAMHRVAALILRNIHCSGPSISAACDSFMTGRSNHRCAPRIGTLSN